MARPKKPLKDKMDLSLRIPVTEEQRQMIVDAGKQAGTGGYTGWARDILLEAARKQLGSSQAQAGRVPKR